MSELWSHQPKAILYLNEHEASMLDAAMSSGKSYMSVQNCKHCAAHRNARTLILCPAAVRSVWRREFFFHAPDQFDVVILDGKQNSGKKAELVYEALRLQQSHGRPLVAVVNYESFFLDPIWKVLNSVLWDKLICDESHRTKSYSAQCSKHAWKIGKRSASRTGLTGTLMPNNPGNVFSQYRWLDERIFGKFWGAFKQEYAVMSQFIPHKVDKWINLEELNRKVNLIRYHIQKSVLVLPEKQDIIIEVNLSPAGMRIYQQMRKESIAYIKKSIDGPETDELKTAIGSNGAVQFLRLLQLSQGYVTDDEGDEVNTDTEKRRALLDLIQDCGEPVCVYGWFRHDLKCVERCCDILGLRYGEISGRRKDLTEHATMPDDIDVMGVQCKSGSAGIDLTRSRIGIIMNSGLLSHGDFDQMISRQVRTNQKSNVVFYHLVTKGTVETKLIDERGRKREIVEVLLSEMKEEEVF
jgi:SNF2 family DNA or RNA helicase